MEFGNGVWKYFGSFVDAETAEERRAVLESVLDDFFLPWREERAPDAARESRHIFVFPAHSGNTAPFNGTTLVAHYDRAEGSPGANDNSAAVFMLVETAILLRTAEKKNWRIIFTDREELGAAGAIEDQGAFSLAKSLRGAGGGAGEFFIFDACGTGDWLVLSTMVDHMIRSSAGEGAERVRRQIRLLRDRALETARRLNMENILLAPVPFSDDPGFLRAGIVAQTITALPRAEASRLASEIRNRPGFADSLVSREAGTETFARLLPETWKRLNTPDDGLDRLTPANWRRALRFAAALITS